MNKKSLIITGLISLIFVIEQMEYFFMVIENVQTHLFAAFFFLCMVLFAIALFIFIRYLPETLNRMESATILIIMFSMFLIWLISFGVNTFLHFTSYVGPVIFLLGVIGYFKYRHKINFSFIIWSLFMYIWLGNIYNTMYSVFEY